MSQSLLKIVTDRIQIHVGKKRRSSRWPKVRNEYARLNPTCAVCGGIKKIQIHHIADFSTTPELELATDNLMTLCMKRKCHYLFGHLNSWRSINVDVIEDAKYFSRKIRNRR